MKAVSAAADKGLRVTVYTSGNIPNAEEVMPSLKDRGVERCIFSVFGADEVVHERMTRIRGSFRATIKAICVARNAGLRTEMHFVPLADNFREVEGTPNWQTNTGSLASAYCDLCRKGEGKRYDSMC